MMRKSLEKAPGTFIFVRELQRIFYTKTRFYAIIILELYVIIS